MQRTRNPEPKELGIAFLSWDVSKVPDKKVWEITGGLLPPNSIELETAISTPVCPSGWVNIKTEQSPLYFESGQLQVTDVMVDGKRLKKEDLLNIDMKPLELLEIKDVEPNQELLPSLSNSRENKEGVGTPEKKVKLDLTGRNASAPYEIFFCGSRSRSSQ